MKVTEIAGEFDLLDLSKCSGVSVDDICTVFATLAEALAVHNRADLHDIGVFKLEKRAPRHGNTPDGQPWETPERWQATFDAAPDFADLIESNRTGGDGAPVI